MTYGIYVYFRNYKEDLVMVDVNNLDLRKDLDLELCRNIIGGKKGD